MHHDVLLPNISSRHKQHGIFVLPLFLVDDEYRVAYTHDAVRTRNHIEYVIFVRHLSQMVNEKNADPFVVGILFQCSEFSVVRCVGDFVFLCRTPDLLQGVDDNQFYVRVFFELFVQLLDKTAVQAVRLYGQIEIARCFPAVKHFVESVFQTENTIFESEIQTPCLIACIVQELFPTAYRQAHLHRHPRLSDLGRSTQYRQALRQHIRD